MNFKNKRILFFDGDCGLCSRSVRFLQKRDRAGILHFAPIQGETAAACLPPELRKSLSTVVYHRPQTEESSPEILLRSQAVLCAVIDIRSHWRWLAYPARGIPTGWRDFTYNWVAKNRHRFFPKAACTLPSASERARILP